MKIVYHIEKRLIGKWLNLTGDGYALSPLPDGVTAEIINDEQEEISFDFKTE